MAADAIIFTDTILFLSLQQEKNNIESVRFEAKLWSGAEFATETEPSNKASTCTSAVVGFGIAYGTISPYLSAPGRPSLFRHQIRPQTAQRNKICFFFTMKNLQTQSLPFSFFFFFCLSIVVKIFFTWWTRKAYRTPWTISSSSSGPPPTISSSANTLFMYFIANFTDASLICDKTEKLVRHCFRYIYSANKRQIRL